MQGQMAKACVDCSQAPGAHFPAQHPLHTQCTPAEPCPSHPQRAGRQPTCREDVLLNVLPSAEGRSFKRKPENNAFSRLVFSNAFSSPCLLKILIGVLQNFLLNPLSNEFAKLWTF